MAYLLSHSTFEAKRAIYHSMDPRLQHCFIAEVIGPTMWCKSELVRKNVNEHHRLITSPSDDVIWCFSVAEPKFATCDVRIVQSNVDPDDLNPKVRHMIILDDLMGSNDSRIRDFFIRQKTVQLTWRLGSLTTFCTPCSLTWTFSPMRNSRHTWNTWTRGHTW